MSVGWVRPATVDLVSHGRIALLADLADGSGHAAECERVRGCENVAVRDAIDNRTLRTTYDKWDRRRVCPFHSWLHIVAWWVQAWWAGAGCQGLALQEASPVVWREQQAEQVASLVVSLAQRALREALRGVLQQASRQALEQPWGEPLLPAQQRDTSGEVSERLESQMRVVRHTASDIKSLPPKRGIMCVSQPRASISLS